MADDEKQSYNILFNSQTSDILNHKQKVAIEYVEVKLMKRGKQLSVPLETKRVNNVFIHIFNENIKVNLVYVSNFRSKRIRNKHIKIVP